MTLIGATTENPSFEVIRPLLSRCQVYVLKSLEKEDLMSLLDHALKTDVFLKEREIDVQETTAKPDDGQLYFDFKFTGDNVFISYF